MTCEYCNGLQKHIEGEIYNEAYIVLTPDDSEYPEGFALNVYCKNIVVNGSPLWYSFLVPCCPMCGAKAGDAE